jgi:hypothetical protein
MFLLFILIVLFVSTCTVSAFFWKEIMEKEIFLAVFFVVFLTSFIGLVFTLSELTAIKGKAEYTVKQYAILKETIEDKNLSNQSLMYLNDLYERVENMDNTIKKHKVGKNKGVIKDFYSEDIAELEPLMPILNKSYKNSNYTWENFVN